MLMRLALCFVAVSLLAGCSTSQWEREFTPTASVQPLEASTPVRVREVDWDRLQSGLEAIRREAAASDIPPTEWTQDKRDAAKGHLLRTLQVTADPAQVEVVGRSEFRSTEPLRPDRDGELVALAREVGATEVVWSRRHLGKADTIVQEPVTTYSTVNEWGGRRRHDHSFSESSTTWVPVVVAADEYAYVAYFLRR